MEIDVKNISKFFAGQTAVSNLTFSVNKGEIFTLLGPNGAGKTTTLKLLSTLLQPTSGTAKIKGHDLLVDKKNIRRYLSVMPQGNALDPFLSVYDNLRFFLKLNKELTKERENEIIYLLTELDLQSKIHQPVLSLSGGQYRRVQFARILLSKEDIILLDEPTLGIDLMGKLKIWEHIRSRKEQKGWTVLLSTNDLSEAETLSDKILFLRKGEAVSVVSADLLKKKTVQKTVIVEYAPDCQVEPAMFESFTYETETSNRFKFYCRNDEYNVLLQTITNAGRIHDLESKGTSLTETFKFFCENRA